MNAALLRALACSVLIFCTSLGAPALAQGQPAAEALFNSGKEAADQGDWALACDRFEESLRLEPAPGTLLNLARCREELGQLASAWKRYREVKDKLPKSDPRHDYAQGKEAELSPRVPRLTLLPPQTSVPVKVTLGEVELSAAAFGVALPLDPGKTTVRVLAEGHEPWVIEIMMEEGATIQQRLSLGALSQTDEQPELAEPTELSASAQSVDSEGRPQPLAWTALGLGIAATAVGTAGFIWSAVELSTVNAHCDPNRICDEIGMDAGARGRTAVALGAVGLSAGAVGMVSGFLLLGGKGDGEQLASPGEVRIAAVPLIGGGAILLGGRLK